MNEENPIIIDLKKDGFFLPQYVDLRNHYVDLLLTNSVTVEETKKWLVKESVEVRCLVDNHTLVGVVILYLNKKGEISLFVKDRYRGIGSQLLKAIEGVARGKKLDSIWARVISSNLPARKVFTKNGYLLEKEAELAVFRKELR